MKYDPDYIKYRLKWSDRPECVFCVELFTVKSMKPSKFSIFFSFSLCYINNFPYFFGLMNKLHIIRINQNVWFYRQPLEVQCKIWVLEQNYLNPTGLIQFFISLALSLHMISNEMWQLKWMFCFLGCIWIVWLCVCVLYSSSWMVGLCNMNVITGQICF